MSVLQDLVSRDIGPYIYYRKDKMTKRERIPWCSLLENTLFFKTPLKEFETTHMLREALMSESINADHKYNKTNSIKKIPDFITFYDIDMTQFKREKPYDYVNFNDFFTREIKPEVRPVASQEDSSVIVSPADCRMTVFESIDEAHELFIKGKQFDLEHLVGSDRQDIITKFKDGSAINARLTPCDYHRFHTCISGKITEKYALPGQTYDTEVMALQSNIDILTGNERTIIVVESDNLSMLFIPIGARDVGLIRTNVNTGDTVTKGDEIGYFHYGGSDIFVMFDKKLKWDEDIRTYSLKTVETLVQVNEKIGSLETD